MSVFRAARFAAVQNNIYTVASNWFVNRCPLVTRVPCIPVGATRFKVGQHMQNCQVWKRSVRSGGIGGSTRMLPTERQPPFEPSKMEALTELMEEMEVSSYYGLGNCGEHPGQYGLRSLLMTNCHQYVSGTKVSAYKLRDLHHDTFEACGQYGGEPDVLLVSIAFKSAFEIWGAPLRRIDAGVSVFDEPIDVFESPQLPGVSIVVAPLLERSTAVVLTSSEVRLRMQWNGFWNPATALDSSAAGAWAAEGAIEVDNEAHHAWVEGIEAFAKS